MSIDLQKLEQKFGELFADENAVSEFSEWLYSKIKSQNAANLTVIGSTSMTAEKASVELPQLTNPNQWISVKDEMPKNKQQVFAALNYAGAPPVCQCIFTERYCTESVDWVNVFVGLNGGFFPHQGVTHWMPIPHPPKPKAE